MNTHHLYPSLPALAASITKAASKQTYYTIRFLVDRDRVQEAYYAYAYFRWVDDLLDAPNGTRGDRLAFVARQQSLLERCARREALGDIVPEEQMLVLLAQNNPGGNSGLQAYLTHMMAVMAFDAGRRGRFVSQAELDTYTHDLASAVTEAMHYFIGHCCFSPQDESRYQAVTAAHITHMLRDMVEDIQAGYYNVPGEVLEASHITLQDIHSPAFRSWVQGQVQLARAHFQAGRAYLHRVENLRCKLAGFAYTARFEWLLDTIEREGYCLRAQYGERKSFWTGLKMSRQTLYSLAHPRRIKAAH